MAALAVVAALLGLAFAKILYATEDLDDKVWGNRPEWARPAVGGVALGLLLLARLRATALQAKLRLMNRPTARMPVRWTPLSDSKQSAAPGRRCLLVSLAVGGDR